MATDVLKLIQFTERKFIIAHELAIEQLSRKWQGVLAKQLGVEFVAYPFTQEEERMLITAQLYQDIRR